MTEPEVEVRPPQRCARCGAPILAAVTVSLPDQHHPELHRRITATVCPECDRHHPAREVQGVIAYFTLHEQVSDNETEAAGQILADWAQYVVAHPPTYGDDELDADIEQWERGEL